MTSWLGKYCAAIGGGIAVAFAVMLPVIFAAAGMAIDVGESNHVRQRLCHALDAAALAGASASAEQHIITDYATNFFNRNYPEDSVGDIELFEVDVTDDEVIARVRAHYRTNFMRVIGRDQIAIECQTAVRRIIQGLEVSMILDITGSMAGQRIVELRQSAKALVDIVISETHMPHEESYVKVAMVPYSMGVNVGSYANQIRGPVSGGTCTSPGCASFRFRNAWNGNWTTLPGSTCVSERVGPLAYTDDPPSLQYMGYNYTAPNNPCIPNQIVPLTNDKDFLHAQIDALVAGGSTAAHVGVAWGWYLLSPRWGYLWPEENRPAPYDDDRIKKVAVLMTDGEFNSPYCNGVISQDSTPGSGSPLYHINCNAPNGSSYLQAENLCASMKEAGVIVYTVGFHIYDMPEATQVMHECATDPSHVYLTGSGEELDAAFRDIARKISTLHISQ